MKIRELMTQDVETCSMDDTLQRAAAVMSDTGVGIIPIVTSGNKLEGVLTDRDIVVRAIAKGMDTNTTKVSECMSERVVSCAPEADAHEAARLMADNQIRRLMVVEDGKLCGVCSLGDMAVIGIHENEAGFALSEISEPDRSAQAH
jgi:CBS domain-containing protein